MINITYLIGAGASCKALPTIKEMEQAIISLIEYLDADIRDYQSYYSQNESAVPPLENAKIALRSLLSACQNHLSIDTYAKMLFLTRQEEKYLQLKNSIILLFELHYYYNKEIEKRYDAFLASILSRDYPKFPEHINVISWNYDYEFEKAYSKYCTINSELEEVFEEFNIYYKNSMHKIDNLNPFRLVKINGTASYQKLNGTREKFGDIKLGVSNFYVDELNRQLNNEKVNPLLHKHNFFATSNDYKPAISFAWEGEINNDTVIAEAIKIMKQTEILIVVGYSFPYFNREIDKMLLSEVNAPQLTKVFVQDKEPENIIETMKGFRKNSWAKHLTRMIGDFSSPSEKEFPFIPIKNLDQFYMPHEL